jgi:hypothetical protein
MTGYVTASREDKHAFSRACASSGFLGALTPIQGPLIMFSYVSSGFVNFMGGNTGYVSQRRAFRASISCGLRFP